MNFRSIIMILMALIVAVGSADAETLKKRRKKKKRGKEVAFKAGQIGASAGAGFVVKGNYSKSDYSIYGTNEFDKGFPINIRAEYGVTDFLGIGVWYGMYKEKVTIQDVTVPTNSYGYDHKFTQLALRPAFHVPLGHPKLDPYVAIPFGMNMTKATPDGNEHNHVQEPLKSGFGWAIHGGANYYFTSNIGAFVEGGYGSWFPMVNFGLSFKL